MIDTEQPESSRATFEKIASASAVAGIAAFVAAGMTGTMSSKVPGEIIALVLLLSAAVMSIIALGSMSRHGTKKILGPALVGLAIPALLLAIAIPNFVRARSAALNGNANWKRYELAGVQLMSPGEFRPANFSPSLKNLKLSSEQKRMAEENAKRSQMYQVTLPNHFGINLTRMELPEGFSFNEGIPQAVEHFKQQFPHGFQSSIRDVTVDNLPAKRVSIQFKLNSDTGKAEWLVVVKPPYIYNIQVIGPATLPRMDEDIERVLQSVKVL